MKRVAVGIGLPLVATSLAALPIDISTATAALVYVLGVTGAAVLGGVVAGLVASFISFLGLNFFFTPPHHTFVVTKPEDLIALVVFLLVSATVGTLISTTLAQRTRAETREREAAQAREEAEANRSRAALFSSVTHDLRTPLASITASVTGLLRDEHAYSEADRRELLETIHQEAGRLNRVVGNLMDLSRIRAGALVPSRSLAGVDEVVDAVVARMSTIARGHTLDVQIEDGVPDIPIDVVQIDQVLTNVLENAARFSSPGSRIGVAVTHDPSSVRVAVADEGEGVRVEDHERIFEPFVRGDGSGGTGLGLAISRAIIEAHGGRIWVQHGEVRGATIVFELPVSQ